jgi:hypothetical protein
MARSKHRLTAKQVHTLGPGKHADGGGLYLPVEPTGARRWMFRYSFASERREQGVTGAIDQSAVVCLTWPVNRSSRTPASSIVRRHSSNTICCAAWSNVWSQSQPEWAFVQGAFPVKMRPWRSRKDCSC